MSPARLHRERLAAAAVDAIPVTQIGSNAEGGQSTPTAFPPSFDMQMTPAREHRIANAVASSLPGDAIDAIAAHGDPIAAQFALRLAHDLRRLKQIQSIELKVAAKREMIGEYASWCMAILSAERTNVRGVAAEVLPTIMVWAIDIADWDLALMLATHVVDNDVTLPARYQRTAPALLAENVAEQAFKLQGSDQIFPRAVLDAVEELTSDHDMHDQIRAKLMKAIGVELQREADSVTGADAVILAAERALAPLRRAHQLDDRVGVKDRIKRLEKMIVAANREADAARAAEEETARLAAQAEAERIAHEAETARLAAEAETARLAAEAEQEAAGVETARIAAEAEASRVAAKKAAKSTKET